MYEMVLQNIYYTTFHSLHPTLQVDLLLVQMFRYPTVLVFFYLNQVVRPFYFPIQHFLYFLPLPQWQGSFLPSFFSALIVVSLFL